LDEEIEFEIDQAQKVKIPPSISTNTLEILDERFKEGSEAYFKKSIYKKLISSVRLD